MKEVQYVQIDDVKVLVYDSTDFSVRSLFHTDGCKAGDEFDLIYKKSASFIKSCESCSSLTQNLSDKFGTKYFTWPKDRRVDLYY